MKKIIFSIGLMLATATAFATVQTKTTQDKPWRVFLLSDAQNLTATTDHNETVYENAWGNFEADDDDGSWQDQTWINYNHVWVSGIGGAGSEYNNWQSDYWDYQGNHSGSAGGMTGNMFWDWTGWGVEVGTYNDGTTTTGFTNTLWIWDKIGNEHCNVSDPVNKTWDDDYSAWGDDNDRGSQHDTYTRTADTVWHVQTGGKAIPGRKNLWQFSGSASEILDKRAVPQFYGANMREVTNKTQIALGSLGNLKADGNLWLTLPDDTEKDITPTVAGKDFFTFSVGGQKYTLTIAARGNGNNYDLSTDTPEFCAGQLLTFTPSWSPWAPPYTNSLQHWTLPDKYVNEAYPYSTYCNSYRKNTDLLTNLTSQCWYVNGGGGTAIIGMNLQFANGQTTGIAAMGDFTIYRPSFSGFSKIDPQFPNSPRSFLWDGNVLSYGNPQTDEHEQYWEVNVDSKYNGAIGILQLLKAKYVQNYGLFPMPYNVLLDTGENDWLDGNAENYEQNPYSATNAWTHKIALTDKPKADLNTVFPYNIHMEGHFTDYLRFQPIGDGSIFVTLGQNDWSMEGLGSLFLGLLTNYTPEPSDLTGSDQFPVWKGQKNE